MQEAPAEKETEEQQQEETDAGTGEIVARVRGALSGAIELKN